MIIERKLDLKISPDGYEIHLNSKGYAALLETLMHVPNCEEHFGCRTAAINEMTTDDGQMYTLTIKLREAD